MLQPCLPTAASRSEAEAMSLAPEVWCYQPKMNGLRAVITVTPTRVAVHSRRGTDITDRHPTVAQDPTLMTLPPGTVLDGEIVAPNFSDVLRSGVTRSFFAFDVFRIGNGLLVNQPYIERYRQLSLIVDKVMPNISDPMTVLDGLEPDGLIEGVVFKHSIALHRPGRSFVWRKYVPYLTSAMRVIEVTGDPAYPRVTVATADCLLTAVLGGTIAGYNLPYLKVGAVVQVRHRGYDKQKRVLILPVFAGIRDDVDPDTLPKLMEQQ